MSELTCKQKVARLMASRGMEIAIIVLIVIYSLLVFGTVILDDNCSGNSDALDRTLTGLKYTELVILTVFAVEIILKCYSFGFKVSSFKRKRVYIFPCSHFLICILARGDESQSYFENNSRYGIAILSFEPDLEDIA